MRTLIIILSSIALVLGLWLQFSLSPTRQPAPPMPAPSIEGLLWPQSRPLPAFQLTDQHGQAFGLEQLKGHWSLLFFGYTHCPDVCPMTLGILRAVKQQLLTQQEVVANTQYVFVSVDGERDTPEVLAQYLRYFDQDFIGLTGSAEALKPLTDKLGIVFMQVPVAETDNTESTDNYFIDHTTSIVLVDPKGRMIGIFSSPHKVEDFSQRYVAMRQFLAEHETP